MLIFKRQNWRIYEKVTKGNWFDMSKTVQKILFFLICELFLLRSIKCAIISHGNRSFEVINHKIILSFSPSNMHIEDHGKDYFKIRHNGMYANKKMVLNCKGDHFRFLPVEREKNEMFSRGIPVDIRTQKEKFINNFKGDTFLLSPDETQKISNNWICSKKNPTFLIILKNQCLQAFGQELQFVRITNDTHNHDDNDAFEDTGDLNSLISDEMRRNTFSNCSTFQISFKNTNECDFDFVSMFRSSIFVRPFADNLSYVRNMVDMIDNNGFKC